MNIPDYLDEKDISRQEFAERIGVSPSVLSHYISGRAYPPLPVAQRILDASSGAITLSDLVRQGNGR